MLFMVVGVVLSTHLFLSANLRLPTDLLSQLVLLAVLGSGVRGIAMWSWWLRSRRVRSVLPNRTRI